MRPVVIVLIKPKRKLGSALLGIMVSMSMNPFAQSGLDKTFCFTVGTRSVGASEDVLET